MQLAHHYPRTDSKAYGGAKVYDKTTLKTGWRVDANAITPSLRNVRNANGQWVEIMLL